MCIFPFFLPSAAAERIAWLSASLPPEVKMISRGSAPIMAAISARDASSVSLASCPSLYRLDGFPHVSLIRETMVHSAVSHILVVAAWST